MMPMMGAGQYAGPGTPEAAQYANQGMPSGMMACKCCGRPVPVGSQPQLPMDQVSPMPEGMDQNALMMALMGQQGGQLPGY